MITIISGTNRAHSKSRAIAELYGELLSNRQIENTILDLADLPIDFIHTALYHILSVCCNGPSFLEEQVELFLEFHLELFILLTYALRARAGRVFATRAV
jgi:hypothetical protein